MKTPQYTLIALTLVFAAAFAFAADSKEVMPAYRRTQILATAKALFEPQIRKSLKIGRVSSPFTASF